MANTPSSQSKLKLVIDPIKRLWPCFQSHLLKNALAVPVLITLLILIAWYIPLAETNFHLEIITDAVGFDFSDTWGFSFENSLLNGFLVTNVDSPEKDTLEAHEVRILTLEIHPADFTDAGRDSTHPGSMEISSNGSFGELFVKNGIIEAEYKNDPPKNKRLKQTLSENRFAGKTFTRFQTLPFQTQPTRLRFSTTHAWYCEPNGVTRFHFNTEQEPGAANFISKIKSGHLKVLDSNRSIEIAENQKISVAGITERHYMRIKKDPQGLKLTFVGKAGTLKGGPKGFEEDLRPRVLERLYHFKPLIVFLWAASILFAIYNYLRDPGQKDK